MGIVVGAAIGGEWKRRLMFGGIAGVMTAAVLGVMSATGWFTDPGLGPVVIVALGLGIALIAVFLLTGFNNKRALYTALTVVAIGVDRVVPDADRRSSTRRAGRASGPHWLHRRWARRGLSLFGGPDKWVSARIGGIVGGFMYAFLWLDFLMSQWQTYTRLERHQRPPHRAPSARRRPSSRVPATGSGPSTRSRTWCCRSRR